MDAIFFENDEGHAASVASCAGIKVIKVSSGSEAPNPASADNFYVKYIDKVRALIRAHVASKAEAEHLIAKTALKYYAGSGIGSQHNIVLSEWVFNGGSKYLILDWDRTLTQVEGILLPHETLLNNSENESYSLEEQLAIICSESVPGSPPLKLPEDALEQMVQYLCGGAERVAFIRSFVAYAIDAGLKIVILTNNPVAVQKAKYFKTVAEQLLGVPFRVICSARGTPANGNKREAIKLDPELGNICGLEATMPPKGPSEYNIVATTPSTYKRGGGKHKRHARTIKLRRFMRRLRATRHGRPSYRSAVAGLWTRRRRLVHKP